MSFLPRGVIQLGEGNGAMAALRDVNIAHCQAWADAAKCITKGEKTEVVTADVLANFVAGAAGDEVSLPATCVSEQSMWTIKWKSRHWWGCGFFSKHCVS